MTAARRPRPRTKGSPASRHRGETRVGPWTRSQSMAAPKKPPTLAIKLRPTPAMKLRSTRAFAMLAATRRRWPQAPDRCQQVRVAARAHPTADAARSTRLAAGSRSSATRNRMWTAGPKVRVACAKRDPSLACRRTVPCVDATVALIAALVQHTPKAPRSRAPADAPTAGRCLEAEAHAVARTRSSVRPASSATTTPRRADKVARSRRRTLRASATRCRPCARANTFRCAVAISARTAPSATRIKMARRRCTRVSATKPTAWRSVATSLLEVPARLGKPSSPSASTRVVQRRSKG